jgi:hypothetical protein
MTESQHHNQLGLFTECALAFQQKHAVLPSYIKDHRKRLRDRFLTGGADAMPDYELLELVLFRAIPRRDVRPLARQLLEHFGDLIGFYRPLSNSLWRFQASEMRLRLS